MRASSASPSSTQPQAITHSSQRCVQSPSSSVSSRSKMASALGCCAGERMK
ncbi:hypothetical protein [Salinicola tamaricis]|uniref:hypothetical protein n=1 Tax=Salinicola tamaricis TaxID=1771309 RepID=UPI0013EC6025|nr:hypothetical protein [Salinicola tamaricis]